MRRVSLRTRRQAVFEILIVTLGILLAFGLDAAWDDYQDGRRERIHLQALESSKSIVSRCRAAIGQ